MFKLTTLLATFFFFGYGWLADFRLPRLTQTGADFVLMPLLGYITIILAAQVAARLSTAQRATAKDE